MANAGYDPTAMIDVMNVLASASASMGKGPPETLSTHPHPENRVEKIQDTIDALFPKGTPADFQSK
ncbi:MAG: hypothetical protein GWQ05_06130 [Verrucomicrobiaceae bacterium]|nr:hypothetical protein [Verrucomicrobiaceae bacterium]NCF90525.1 hypothetical protein [Verrucomicrobiaceae bacterium]